MFIKTYDFSISNGCVGVFYLFSLFYYEMHSHLSNNVIQNTRHTKCIIRTLYDVKNTNVTRNNVHNRPRERHFVQLLRPLVKPIVTELCEFDLYPANNKSASCVHTNPLAMRLLLNPKILCALSLLINSLGNRF